MHPPAGSSAGRMFRRHRMGLPSVLIVAALAAAGLGWTLDQSATPPAEAGLARGCLVPQTDALVDPCATSTNDPAPSGRPSLSSLACVQTWREGGRHITVWDDGTRLWLDWDLPSSADPAHPLASTWITAWWGPTPLVDHVLMSGGRAQGFAAYPLPELPDDLAVHAGTIAVGGHLTDGLRAFEVQPFGFTDGVTRLAGSINDGEITLEVPSTRALEVRQGDESLSFAASKDYGALLSPC